MGMGEEGEKGKFWVAKLGGISKLGRRKWGEAADDIDMLSFLLPQTQPATRV